MTIRAINNAISVNSGVQSSGRGTRVGENVQQNENTTQSSTVNDSKQGRVLADALYRQTIYDQPRDTRTSAAIATYKEYAFLERREEVKSMLHVSVYA